MKEENFAEILKRKLTEKHGQLIEITLKSGKTVEGTLHRANDQLVELKKGATTPNYCYVTLDEVATLSIRDGKNNAVGDDDD